MKGNARLQVDNPLTITTILDVRPTANSQTCRIHVDAILTCQRVKSFSTFIAFKAVYDGSSILVTDHTSSIGSFYAWTGGRATAASGDHYIRCNLRCYSLRIERQKGVTQVFLEDSMRAEAFVGFAAGGASNLILDVNNSSAILDWPGLLKGNGSVINSSSGAKFYIEDASALVSSANVSYNDVQISDNSSPNLSGTITFLGDLNIESGAELNSNGNDVTIGGSLVVNGTFSSSTTETITFNSSAATQETITGTGTLAFPKMVINTNLAGGVIVNTTDTLDIKVGLEIDQGTLSTNDTKVRLYSDATNTAYLGVIGSNGALDGELILRKFISGLTGDADWYYLHVPISGANISVAQEGTSPNGVYTYGYVGSNGNTTITGGYVSSYTYQESAPTTDFDEGWIPDGSGSTFNYTNGRIFRMGGSSGVGAKSTYILQAGGAIIDGAPGAISGANTSQTGTPNFNGWHLAANPYPCPITFNVAGQTNGQVQASELYVYNPQGGGTWSTIDNGAIIPAWQTFFYQAAVGQTAVITFTESDKLESSTTAWIKKAKDEDALAFSLCSDSLGVCQDLKTEFNDDADLGFDGYDAFGLRNPWPRPNAYIIVEDSFRFRKNRIPTETSQYEFPIEIDVEFAGQYTLNVTDLPNFSTCQSIEDLVTGDVMRLDENFSYTFTQTDLNPTRRFLVSVSNPITAINAQAASCFDSENGSAEFEISSAFGNYSLLVDNANGDNVFSAFDTAGVVNLSDLKAGVYSVLIENSDFSCSIDEQFEIFEPSQIVSDFSISNLQPNVHPSASESVSFTNNSSGASQFSWNFGDGSPISTDVNPTHLYTEAGTYSVVLSAGNGNQDCDQSFTSLVQAVNNAPASTLEAKDLKPYSMTVGEDIKFNFDEDVERVSVLNTLGQEVYNNKNINNQLDIRLIENGVYLINIEMGGKSYVEKVALSN